MNWAWATSIDQLWRSPNFPLWLTLAAGVFFGLIALVTLLRATKSLANGALTLITLLAIGIAVAATLRNSGPTDVVRARSAEPSPQIAVAMTPALSCIDDLAGEAVLAACEKALFGSADAVAAAVSYASSRISQLTALGDVATADRVMTPDQAQLRRAIERDRYGLVAYVLSARDRCQPGDCAAYKSLTDHNQIAANMDEHVYEAAVQRHAVSWGAPAASQPAAPALAGLTPVAPNGKPTTADFPTANSIPPVNIMTPEPPAAAAAAPKPPAAAASVAAKPPATAVAAKPATALPKPPPSAANAQAAQTAAQAPAARKPPAPKQRPAPVQLAPAAASSDNE
jgi:hypothetical protein